MPEEHLDVWAHVVSDQQNRFKWNLHVSIAFIYLIPASMLFLSLLSTMNGHKTNSWIYNDMSIKN